MIVSALSFGAMAIFARRAYAAGVDTATLLALRFGIAAVAMAALLAVRGVAWPRGRVLGGLVLLGALGYGGQAFTFFTALTLAPAGLVALLLYLHPALVALLAAAFLHERLTRWKLAALGAGAGRHDADGGPGADRQRRRRRAGRIAFGVAAATIYAVYIVTGTRLARHAAPLAMAAVVIASAAAVFIVAAAGRGPRWPADAGGWAAVAAIALVSTVAAITLFFAGLERIGPVRASTLSTVEPLFTVALAAIVLGETIAPVQLAGGALILAAVVVLARAR